MVRSSEYISEGRIENVILGFNKMKLLEITLMVLHDETELLIYILSDCLSC